MGGFSARVRGTGKGGMGMGRGWKSISFSICFLEPEGFLRLQIEMGVSDRYPLIVTFVICPPLIVV